MPWLLMVNVCATVPSFTTVTASFCPGEPISTGGLRYKPCIATVAEELPMTGRCPWYATVTPSALIGVGTTVGTADSPAPL
jgi:hypothetical protein